MASEILNTIAGWIIHVISSLDYLGIVLLMAIESANVPLPSEIIMPFSGFLVAKGVFNLYFVALAGALGCLVGSIFSYYLGVLGGRPLIEKYGKYFLISHRDLDLAERWFNKYGESIVFFSRLLPVVRTFISFPAGIARMNFLRFSLYSFLGSFPWTLLLAWIGLKMGADWENIRTYFRGFDWLILGLIVVGAGWWILRHMKHNRNY